MEDVFDILTPQKPPKVTDSDFFSPGGYPIGSTLP